MVAMFGRTRLEGGLDARIAELSGRGAQLDGIAEPRRLRPVEKPAAPDPSEAEALASEDGLARARRTDRPPRGGNPPRAAGAAEPRRFGEHGRGGGAGLLGPARDQRRRRGAPRSRRRNHPAAGDIGRGRRGYPAECAPGGRRSGQGANSTADPRAHGYCRGGRNAAAGFRGAAGRLGPGTARRGQDTAELYRAAGTRRGAGRRHARARPARAPARRRQHQRCHGQRPEAGLCRAPRQARSHRCRFSRQSAPDEHLQQNRDPGRPPDRRDEPAGRCAPARRQPGQHHHPAAGNRWRGNLDPQILEKIHHARHDGGKRQHLAGNGDAV